MNNIFITGMFRSGTTFMTKVLSAHPQLLVVSDPYIYFFKTYRNFLYEKNSAKNWHPDEPMSDFFLDENFDVLEKIKLSDLSEPIPKKLKQKIRKDIEDWKIQQHPALCRRLDEVEGNTFAEFYDSLIKLLQIVYGNYEITKLGTKVGWSEEFIPALNRAFPEMKFLIMVRDIRSIIASQNSKKGFGSGKRPLLFYIRQWRKSVAFANIYTKLNDELKSKVYLIKYEDLITNTERTLRYICDFLNIDYYDEMLDPNKYKDEAFNKGWLPNTSFEPKSGIYNTSIDKWKSTLLPKEIQMTETLSAPEMNMMDYRFTTHSAPMTDFLLDPPEPEFDELAEWIKPFHCCDYLRNETKLIIELSKEMLRKQIFQRGIDLNIESKYIRRLFIDENYFRLLLEKWKY